MEALACDKVFVLGAGFSRLAGLPLVSSLRQEVFSYIRQNRLAPDWAPHLRCGDHGYPTGQFRAGLRGVDRALGFEELLAELDRRLAGAGPEDPAFITRLMLVQAVERLVGGTPISTLPPAYSNFARWARAGRNAIVSFNWDLVAERALEDAHVPWGYSVGRGPTPVLKPHGSINWSRHLETRLSPEYSDWEPISAGSQYCFDSSDRFRDPFFNPTEKTFVNDYLRYVLMPGSDEVSCPSACLIWQDVEGAMKHRDAVVFIGYSLPGYDAFARTLLRRCAGGKRIQVITPSSAHCEGFVQVFGSQVSICPQRFEDCPYAQPRA